MCAVCLIIVCVQYVYVCLCIYAHVLMCMTGHAYAYICVCLCECFWVHEALCTHNHAVVSMYTHIISGIQGPTNSGLSPILSLLPPITTQRHLQLQMNDKRLQSCESHCHFPWLVRQSPWNDEIELLFLGSLLSAARFPSIFLKNPHHPLAQSLSNHCLMF